VGFIFLNLTGVVTEALKRGLAGSAILPKDAISKTFKYIVEDFGEKQK